MRFSVIVCACLLSSACGGDGGTGPTTNHRMTGSWSYLTTQLADGHATTCSALAGSAMTVTTQRGADFSGRILGGAVSCRTGSINWEAGFGLSDVTNGVIDGDSVVFDFDGGNWRSWGRFVTEDSLAGIVNGIYPASGGGSLILTGFWSAIRDN